MTKTFTTTKGEYLLVKIDNPFANDLSKIKFDAPLKEYAIISLLKDITEEQAKEIVETHIMRSAVLVRPSGYIDIHVYSNYLYPFSSNSTECFVNTAVESVITLLNLKGIDTSLNWLLLKKI